VDDIDLSGTWTARLDRDRVGVEEAWHEAGLDGDPCSLPGTLRASGLGDPVGPDTDWIALEKGNFDAPRYAPYRDPEAYRLPYWLQPDRHYVGVAWYERTVTVPESWADRQVTLCLERPHWHTTVWVDGSRVGSDDSLSTPHEYDVTDAVTPGETRLTVRIDNSLADLDVGVNAHSVSDHTQSAWDGAVGELSLRARPPVAVADVQVVTDAAAGTARATVSVGNSLTDTERATLSLTANCEGETLAAAERTVEVPPGETAVETTLDLGPDAPRWDAIDPSLCRLDVALKGDSTTDEASVRFGVRDVETDGTRVVVNDRPVSLRGTLDCCVFPETGHPPTDVASWREEFRTVLDHGLNHVRFHSWCPPEAAFEAADELGVYLQVECSTWPNQSAALGEGRPIDDWLYREGERVLAACGNHPSVVLLAAGNEPGGDHAAYLSEWVPAMADRAERCLVTGGAGWPVIEENEVHVSPEPRVHGWGDGLDDHVNRDPPATTVDYRDVVERYPETPTVAHESGQWCAYPNVEEIPKYEGQLRARNYEVFRDLLARAGLADRAAAFHEASGRLQELCYEEEVESALRTPGLAGVQLLSLGDFPGQGTAPVGVLDAFRDAKPYHDPERFRQFAGPTVPLARLDRRSFTTGDRFAAALDLSHFGASALTDAAVRWRLAADDGTVVADGSVEARDYPTGRLHEVGAVDAALDGVDAPARLTLAVEVPAADARNTWDVWVFPEASGGGVPEGVTVSTAFDEEARARLADGETVALFAPPESVATDLELGFTPVFWNTAWTEGQAPHTMGLLPDPEHPALDAFPTDAHTDWQWWDPIANGAAMELDGLPAALDPVVEVVPDWFDPERLGLVFEARVGDGRLLAASVDLTTDLWDRPAARQLRRSLLRYAASEAFDPTVAVSPDAVRDLFASDASR
jgi:hypothetical protein